MGDRVPISVQAEAAHRARHLYQALGEPRRVFSTLIRLSQRCGHQRHLAAAQAALDEARGLIRPNWPTEFRILLLRTQGWSSLDAGRPAEALQLFRDRVRACVALGDWRLEVMARTDLAYLLWQIGAIEEGANEARQLAEELSVKPAAFAEMAIHFANLMGILSEMGRIEEASAVAVKALPIMRQARVFYIDEWAYLFWRRGEIDVATQLLGASDAHEIRADAPRYQVEQRLLDEARAALKADQRPESFASRLAAGAALSEGELFALISENLAQSRGNGQ
jgi:tetratricopeptide (TPR) repeat protein